MASSKVNKEKLSITLDSRLVRRIDLLAEKRGTNRSSFIERVLLREIGVEERWVDQMENPVYRGVLRALTETPGLLESMATMLGDHLNTEEAAEFREGAKKQIRSGKARRQEKARGRKRPKKPG